MVVSFFVNLLVIGSVVVVVGLKVVAVVGLKVVAVAGLRVTVFLICIILVLGCTGAFSIKKDH